MRPPGRCQTIDLPFRRRDISCERVPCPGSAKPIATFKWGRTPWCPAPCRWWWPTATVPTSRPDPVPHVQAPAARRLGPSGAVHPPSACTATGRGSTRRGGRWPARRPAKPRGSWPVKPRPARPLDLAGPPDPGSPAGALRAAAPRRGRRARRTSSPVPGVDGMPENDQAEWQGAAGHMTWSGVRSYEVGSRSAVPRYRVHRPAVWVKRGAEDGRGSGGLFRHR